jgi:FlaA1/EpsC-like NDP-sugar epimerase
MPSPSAANGPDDHDHLHPLDSLWSRLTGLSPSVPRPPRQSLTGKRILVTGAGGSIGSALTRTIAASHPASLILLDSAEHSLYEIDRALAGVPHTAILGSVTDRPLLAELFRQHRPQIIVHAAAFKHVPLIEQNPFAAIANNALGTYALAQSALLHRAEHLLLVSTDKAVDPHSLMGATKRIAELIILALAHSGSVAATNTTKTTRTTKMTAVRLGNVLGSHGSVVPLFLHQIACGGPITVTHPEARRYFLTLAQTVTALLDALETPAAVEAPEAPAVPGTSTILIPELAPPIRILDLAHHLLAQHSSSAEIVFTGLRPGDKLEESLLSPHESLRESGHESIPESTWESTRGHCPPDRRTHLRAISSSAPTAAALESAMHHLDHALQRRDLAAALRTVLHLVPEYTPSAQLATAIPNAEEARA